MTQLRSLDASCLIACTLRFKNVFEIFILTMLSKWQNINFVVNYSFMCICAAEMVENGSMRVLTLCVPMEPRFMLHLMWSWTVKLCHTKRTMLSTMALTWAGKVCTYIFTSAKCSKIINSNVARCYKLTFIDFHVCRKERSACLIKILGHVE